MKKDDKTLLWVIGIIILLANPGLLVLGIIGYIVYISYKDKNKVKSTASNLKEKIKNSDKTHNYEVIDTTAEVIDSKIMPKEEWKATKEYKH